MNVEHSKRMEHVPGGTAATKMPSYFYYSLAVSHIKLCYLENEILSLLRN